MNVDTNRMLAAGVLKMTEPDNPTSRNQMYVTAEEAPEMAKCESKVAT